MPPLTIKEFARMLNLSVATISRAYGSPGRISNKTKENILRQAKEFGYIHRASWRLKNNCAKNNILFFYPDLSSGKNDYFINEIIFSTYKVLSKKEFMLQVIPFDPENEFMINHCKTEITQSNAAGAIIVSGAITSHILYMLLKELQIPHIIIGHMNAVDYNCVSFDTYHGAFLAGAHFKKINRRRPAFIGGILDKRKRVGFARGLGISEEYIAFINGGNEFEHGSLAMQQIIDKYPKTDCILCANDILALGAIKTARSKHIKIPEDISFIGFDNLDLCNYTTPALSSVSLHLNDIGFHAGNMLITKIMTQNKLLAPEIIECDLVIRET